MLSCQACRLVSVIRLNPKTTLSLFGESGQEKLEPDGSFFFSSPVYHQCLAVRGSKASLKSLIPHSSFLNRDSMTVPCFLQSALSSRTPNRGIRGGNPGAALKPCHPASVIPQVSSQNSKPSRQKPCCQIACYSISTMLMFPSFVIREY